MSEFWRGWLSGASLSCDDATLWQYAAAFEAADIEADAVHALSSSHLVALGLAPAHAERVAAYALECSAVSDEFERLLSMPDATNAVNPAALLADRPATQSRKRRPA